MNAFHCPDCAQTLSLPESVSPDTRLECPHCGSEHRVEQFLDAADSSPAFSHSEDEFEEVLESDFDSDNPFNESVDASVADAAAPDDEDEMELLSFDEQFDDPAVPETPELLSADEEDPAGEASEVSDTQSESEGFSVETDTEHDEVEIESELPHGEIESELSGAEIGVGSLDAADDAHGDGELPLIELESDEMIDQSGLELEDQAGGIEDEDAGEDAIPFTEFSREPIDEVSDGASGDEGDFFSTPVSPADESVAEEQPFAAVMPGPEFDPQPSSFELNRTTSTVSSAPEIKAKSTQSLISGFTGQVVCPDCSDPVRLPESSVNAEADVRCPWCGSVNPMTAFTRQLPPVLEVVGVDANGFGTLAFDASGDYAITSVEQYDADVHERLPADQGFGREASAPVNDSAGFDMSAQGLQPRPRRRQKPSIVKMLFQWFGGGVLGIGGALAILYFGFPEKFPKFLPFQPPGGRSSSSGGSNEPYTPRDFDPGNASGQTGFAMSNENSDLLDSMELPGTDSSAVETNAAAQLDSPTDAAAFPEPLESVSEPSLVDQRLQAARAALTQAIESDQESPNYRKNLASLYRGLAELGEAVADDPFSKQPKQRAALLLEDIAKQPKLMMSLGDLAPKWLAASARRSDGIFLVSQLGSRTQAQARPGYHSVTLARYRGQSASADPITVFGLLDDLMPYRDQNVIILAVIDDDPTDITGPGRLLKLAAIHPL